MLTWIAALASLSVGFVIGSALAILAIIGNFDSAWLKPDVVGPFAGSFFAALVGVAGAAWVHVSATRDKRDKIRHQERIAIARVFTSSMELYGHMRLYINELNLGANGHPYRPHLVEALKEVISQLAADLKDASVAEILRPEFASVARSGARAFANGISRLILDIPNLDRAPPDARATVPAEQLAGFQQVVTAYQRQLDALYNNLERWESLYNLLEDGLTLDRAIADMTSDLIPIS